MADLSPKPIQASKEIQQLLDSLSTTAALDMKSARSLPPRLYRNEDIAELEAEKIWKQDWVCTGLASELPETGDYLTFSIANERIFCVRDKQGTIRTFSNVCRHRMMQLLEGHGNNRRVTCPYHAWTYDLDGKLAIAGQMKDHKTFVKKEQQRHRWPSHSPLCIRLWIVTMCPSTGISRRRIMSGIPTGNC